VRQVLKLGTAHISGSRPHPDRGPRPDLAEQELSSRQATWGLLTRLDPIFILGGGERVLPGRFRALLASSQPDLRRHRIV